MGQFSEQLTQLMKENGITAVKLANSLSTSPATISRYLSGEMLPSLPKAVQLAYVLNLQLDELVAGTELHEDIMLQNAEFDFSFAARLRNLRTDHQLTLEQVGTLLGITRSAVSKYEAGLSQPTPVSIIKLAKLYNVTTDSILGVPQSVDACDTICATETWSPEEHSQLARFKEFLLYSRTISSTSGLGSKISDSISSK